MRPSQEYVMANPILHDPTMMRQPTPSPWVFWIGSYESAIATWTDLVYNPEGIAGAHMTGWEPEL
jgi:hypothetical protein